MGRKTPDKPPGKRVEQPRVKAEEQDFERSRKERIKKLQENLYLRVLEIDADKDDSLNLCALPLRLQEGSFLFTGVAPRCPEVDDDELPFQVCQVKRLTSLWTQ